VAGTLFFSLAEAQQLSILTDRRCRDVARGCETAAVKEKSQEYNLLMTSRPKKRKKAGKKWKSWPRSF